MQPLQIVMLAPFGIRPKGTLLARMLPLAQALVRRGHRATIIAPAVANPEDAGTAVVFDGVPVIHTPQPLLPAPFSVAEQVHALLQTVFEAQPDVLHLFKPKGYSGLAALAARALRPHLPLVVDTDDWEGWGGWNDLLPYPYPAKLLFAWQERDLPRRAAAITVASRTLRGQVLGFGVAPERVVVVANGVQRSEFRIQRSEFRVQSSEFGMSPRLNPKSKILLLYTRFWEFNLRELVQALVVIGQQCPDVRLLVVGRGERGEEQELLRLAERAGLGAMLDYRGWVEPAAIPALLAQADVALAPLDDTLINRARGLAKLLELMHAGLPIVAHAVGEAATYLEDQRSGLLVPAHHPAAFAQATLQLLHDESLRQRLGAAARERAEQQFNWDQLAMAAEQAYAMATVDRGL